LCWLIESKSVNSFSQLQQNRQSEIKGYVEIYLNLTADCLLKENSQLDIVGQEMKESSADTFIPN
jgi:hypothetical protein